MSRGPGQKLALSLLWLLGALLLFAGVATLRAVLDGEREITASDAAFDANDLHSSIQHARRAASAYAPGALHVERGYLRLLAIARGAEATGRPELAVLAWQAQRAAALESASLFQPFPERLEEASRNLARLQASKLAAEPEQAATAERLFKQAQAQGAAKLPWGSLLGLGLLLAGGGVVWFGQSALGRDGKIAWLRGRWGLLTFALGAALWAVAALRG